MPALAGMWQCLSCDWFSAASGKPGECGRCGCALLGKAPLRSVLASTLPDVEPARVPTGDAALDTLLSGGFARTSVALLYGRGGVGKSRLAGRWATHAGSALYLSLEMPAELCVYSLRQSGADLSRLYVLDDPARLYAEARELGVTCLVVDSITRHPAGEAAALDELRHAAAALGAVGLAIAHQTLTGHARGGSGVQHDPDYELRLRRSARGISCQVRKARYSPSGRVLLSTPSLGPVEGAQVVRLRRRAGQPRK